MALLNGQEMVAFRSGSSLVVGKGKDSNYVCSDIITLLKYTRKIIPLKENQGAILTKNSIVILEGRSGIKKKTIPKFVRIGKFDEDKGGYPHFMLKEIYEQADVLLKLAKRKKDFKRCASLIKKNSSVYFTACGTAANSCIAATYLFSEIAKRRADFVIASEFPYFGDFLAQKSLLITASQSGETIDTLEAVRTAKRHNSKILALVNIPESTLARTADMNFFLEAGPERAVVSTKAYIAKLSVFLALAFCLRGELERGVKLLKRVAKQMNLMFKNGIKERVRVFVQKNFLTPSTST